MECLIVRSTDGGRKIRGTAALYYDGTPRTELHLFGNVYERIAPGAFDESLTNPHVVMRYSHKQNEDLAETPDTLRVWSDKVGLHYEGQLPDSETGIMVRGLVRHEDLRGSSFGARKIDSQWSKEGEKHIVTLTKLDLFDVSPTLYPAYQGTEQGAARVVLRSYQQAIEDEYQRWLTKTRIDYLNTLHK